MAALSRNYRQSIDGLRGLAALLVVLMHLARTEVGQFHFPGIPDFLSSYAHFAVRIFFTLSGIIVCASMQRRESVEASPGRNFYLRRAFRLLPLWWSVLLALVLSGALGPGVAAADALFLYGFGRFDLIAGCLTPAWSLFSELAFYASFPALRKYLWGPTLLLMGTLDLMVVSGFWASKFGAAEHGWCSPLAHFQFFLLGAFLYQVVCSQPVLRALAAGSSRFWNKGLLIDASVLTLIALHAVIYPIHDELVISLLVLASFRGRSLLGSFVRLPLWRHCGRLCYFIYICHLPVERLVSPLRAACFKMTGLGSLPAEYQLMVWFPLFTVLLVSLAMLSERYFEGPCRAAGEALIAKLERRRKMRSGNSIRLIGRKAA